MWLSLYLFKFSNIHIWWDNYLTKCRFCYIPQISVSSVLFSFMSKHFKIYFRTSSLTHGLSRSVFLVLQINMSDNFLAIFLLLLSSLTPLLSENILCMISDFWMCWAMLYGLNCDLSERTFQESVRRMCIRLLVVEEAMGVRRLRWRIALPSPAFTTADRGLWKSLAAVYTCQSLLFIPSASHSDVSNKLAYDYADVAFGKESVLGTVEKDPCRCDEVIYFKTGRWSWIIPSAQFKYMSPRKKQRRFSGWGQRDMAEGAAGFFRVWVGTDVPLLVLAQRVPWAGTWLLEATNHPRPRAGKEHEPVGTWEQVPPTTCMSLVMESSPGPPERNAACPHHDLRDVGPGVEKQQESHCAQASELQSDEA